MRSFVTPLTGFETSEQEIQLDSGLRIRRARPEEKEIFVTQGKSEIVQPSNVFFVVERDLERTTVEEAFQIVDLVLLGLSLMKDYLITEIPVTIFYTSDGKPVALTRNVSLYGNIECILKKAEVEKFIQLFKKLVAKRTILRVPIERFIRAERSIAQFTSETTDYLIDVMIAFEALILRNEEIKTNIGKHIAIATAMLIGKDEEERYEIKKTLLLGYKTRNEIVHGIRGFSVSSEDKERLSSLKDKISGYFKRALFKLL